LPATYVVHVDVPRDARLIGADVPNVTVSARQQTTASELTLAQGDPFDVQLSVSRPFLSVLDTAFVTATIAETSEGKSRTATVTVRARP
jgi:hypothetical protein